MRKMMAFAAVVTAALFGALWVSGSTASAEQTYTVTSTSDDGSPGTLRWALGEAESDDDDSVIQVADSIAGATIQIDDTLVYDGDEENDNYDLTIFGNGITVTDSGTFTGCDLLEIDYVATVKLRNMSVVNGPCTGIDIEASGGDLTVDFLYVTVAGHNDDGLYISDDGDDYSIDLTLSFTTFSYNGDGSDYAGVYVERGGEVGGLSVSEGVSAAAAATLTVDINNSLFEQNDGDGIYLANSDEGDTDVDVFLSLFLDNDYDGMDIESYSFGYVVTLDVDNSTFAGNGDDDSDEGLDVEVYDGGYDVTIDNSIFNDNDDDGLYVIVDSDSESEDSSLAVTNSQAIDNGEDGFDVEFEGRTGDDVDLTFTNTRTNLNGGDGIEIDIDDSIGTATVDLDGITAANNGTDDDEDDGEGVSISFGTDGGAVNSVNVTASTMRANFDDGLDVDSSSEDEDGSAPISVDITDSTFDLNGDDGADIDNNEESLDVDVVGSTFVFNNDDGFYAETDEDPVNVSFNESTLDDNGGDGADIISAADDSGEDSDVVVFAANTTFSRNVDDGLDADSNDDGCGDDVRATLILTTANGNGQSGYEIDACDDVSVIAIVARANANAEEGITLTGDGGSAFLFFSGGFLNLGGSWTADPGISVNAIFS